MYEVICFFTDLQDFDHPYKVGDKFPRDGMHANEDRLKELSGNANRQKKPLIKKIQEPGKPKIEDVPKDYQEQEKDFGYTKTDINRMSTSQLQKLASESGIENANEKSGGELKKMLIEKFSL